MAACAAAQIEDVQRTSQRFAQGGEPGTDAAMIGTGDVKLVVKAILMGLAIVTVLHVFAQAVMIRGHGCFGRDRERRNDIYLLITSIVGEPLAVVQQAADS